MQTIRPSNTQLFCKPIETKQMTSSGFLLAGNEKEIPNTAEVINVGKAVNEFGRGDVIIYKSYATTDITLNSDKYMLINEDDVLGVVLEVERS